MDARSASLADLDGLAALWAAAGLRFRPEQLADEVVGVLRHDAGLALVIEDGGAIVASVLGTFDGRRGWVNRLATHPDHRGRGLAQLLVAELETRLRSRGCRKLNLLVEPDNDDVVAWYERLGYRRDELIFMQKLL